VPFVRPPELSDDYATTSDVVKHCINWCLENELPVSYVCCVYATAPFVRREYLREGYEKLIATGASYAFSVTSFPFPIQRAIRINDQGKVEAIWPENISRRSQDLDEAYHDAGQFYWGKVDAFLNNEVVFSEVSVPVLLPRYLVQDIDTLEDWHRAELMFRVIENMKPDGGA
jgi:N-acylneuraminate cytidylyltransferase